jgi:hypothetical protein
MHPNSMKQMELFRDNYLQHMKGCTVLDVGSMDVEGGHSNYREMFFEYEYIGMDIVPGPNVDLVGWHNVTEVYDVVISGQTMEHVKRPWEWLKNLEKHFKKYICIIAPWKWKEHRYPFDTYRYLPDGMRDLFEYVGIEEISIYKSDNDTVGIGRKKK